MGAATFVCTPIRFATTEPRSDSGWAGGPDGGAGDRMRDGGSRTACSSAGKGATGSAFAAGSATIFDAAVVLGCADVLGFAEAFSFAEAAGLLRAISCTAWARLGRPPVAARTASASSAGFTGRSARASRACAANTAGSVLDVGVAMSGVFAAGVAVAGIDAGPGLDVAARADPAAVFLPRSLAGMDSAVVSTGAATVDWTDPWTVLWIDAAARSRRSRSSGAPASVNAAKARRTAGLSGRPS